MNTQNLRKQQLKSCNSVTVAYCVRSCLLQFFILTQNIQAWWLMMTVKLISARWFYIRLQTCGSQTGSGPQISYQFLQFILLLYHLSAFLLNLHIQSSTHSKPGSSDHANNITPAWQHSATEWQTSLPTGQWIPSCLLPPWCQRATAVPSPFVLTQPISSTLFHAVHSVSILWPLSHVAWSQCQKRSRLTFHFKP